ncbi:MAG: dihydroorotase family protein [Armatimonadetes bacterium]|nr:dihydroorotase family protein [Armatimonadota bacterium]
MQDVCLREGRLEEVRPICNLQSAIRNIEGDGHLLLPGMIDPHVHLRSPGMEAAEDWDSGTRAAARGGVTALFDMPNTRPATTTPARLEEKRALAGVSRVDWGLYLGATSGNPEAIASAGNIAAVKVYMGSSTGDLLVDDEEPLERVFRAAAAAGVPVALHAEDEGIIRARMAALRGDEDATIHGWVRPPEAAAAAVRRALALGERTGAALYFCHVSTEAELALLREAKRAGRAVVVEATPHHLFLDEEDVRRLGNYGKVNPPLRSQRDCAALWEAIRDGTVDVIGTDHAPHAREAKERPYPEAPSGMPGLETALPLLLTAVLEGRLGFERMVDLTSGSAARCFGVESAGWVLADLSTEHSLEPGEIQSRCGWSPFVGRRLRGWPVKVWVRGALVFDGGRFGKAGTGREVCFRREG